MKQLEQDNYNLQLYLTYPLKHFHPYKKIVHPNQYKGSPYKDIQICLTDIIQIFIQYILLMLQSAHKHRSLSIAPFPGYLNKRRLQFYLFDSKGEKGFVNINPDQFIAELSKFFDRLKQIRLLDASFQGRRQDLEEFCKLTHAYLVEYEKYWCQLNTYKTTQRILTLIERMNRNAIVLKYHNLSQIKAIFVMLKTSREPFFAEKYYSPHSSKLLGEWSLAKIAGELLTDLQKLVLINSIEKITYNDNYSVDVEQFKPAPSIVYKLFIDLFGFGSILSQQEKNMMRKKHPEKQLKIQLKIENITPKIMYFTSSFFCQISKQQYVELDTFWLKLKPNLANSVNSLGIQQPIDLSSLILEYEPGGTVLLKHKIKYEMRAGAKLIYSIDLHLLLHWIMIPFVQACHSKLKSQWFNPQDIDLTEDRLNYMKLTTESWVKYLSSIFSSISQNKPFTL